MLYLEITATNARITNNNIWNQNKNPIGKCVGGAVENGAVLKGGEWRTWRFLSLGWYIARTMRNLILFYKCYCIKFTGIFK